MASLSFLVRRLSKLRSGAGSEQAVIDQITRAYRGILGREPDSDGLKAYLGSVISGNQSVAEVVVDLLHSDERKTQQSRAVQQLYRCIFCREPDDAGLQFHISALQRNEATLADIAGNLMQSQEFADRFSRHSNVALRIVETLMVALTGRHPGQSAIESYANALTHGYPLSDFVDELKRSPEFNGGLAMHSGPLPNSVPAEVAILAHDLIASRMVREGSVIGLPPVPVLGAAGISAGQMAALIHTLDMLSIVSSEGAT